MYNINNIVIPMLAKVEKLQYKDIMTPKYGTATEGVFYSILAIFRINEHHGKIALVCFWCKRKEF